MTKERELTFDERARWGYCPICGAEDGEYCYADVGRTKSNGQRMQDEVHIARLQNAPFRVEQDAEYAMTYMIYYK